MRNTKTTSRRSLAMGDLIVFTNPIVDAAGQRTGRLFATCTATVGNRNFLKATMTCTAVMTLRDGTLSAVVNVSPGAPTTTGPIVGGTGAYAGARGVIVSKEASNGDSVDTITLVG